MKTKKTRRLTARKAPKKSNLPQEALVMDVAKSTTFIAEKKELPQPKHAWIGRVLLLFALLLIILVAGVLSVSWWYAAAFEQASGVSLSQTVMEVKNNWTQDPFGVDGRINFLMLGLDQIPGERDSSLLTDTMMLVSLQATGNIHLISIPRDLWIDSLKTKINAVYYYGEQSESSTGSKLAAAVVQDVTGQPIDHVLIVRLATVRQIIDALGGIDVTVKQAFEDDQFPRENADITSKDPAVLYETIHFDEGLQHFDGATALKYIRSRHSTNVAAGTDDARAARQQEVIDALLKKMRMRDTLKNPALMGALYRIWKEQIGEDVREAELVGIGKQLLRAPITIVPSHIPIKEDDQPGLLVNPPVPKYKQWVYEPVDPTWQQLQDWVSQTLK